MTNNLTAETVLLPCVQIDDHRFLARARLGTLVKLCVDPLQTERDKARAGDYRLQRAYELRSEVQREFQGAKARNVPKFADYLVGVQTGLIKGLAPAIKLFCPEPLVIENNQAYIPMDREIVAYDGETQLAAWFSLMASHGEQMHDCSVPLDISHGRETSWARQVWHDVNAFGTRPNTALALAMDTRDPMNGLVDYYEHSIDFLDHHINKIRRQIRGPQDGYFTLTTFRTASLTLARGISGVQQGTRQIDAMAPEVEERLKTVGREWFTALTAEFGDQIQDKTSLLPSPAVFPAVSAVGHPLVSIVDPSERADAMAVLLEDLGRVNFTRGEHWNGIAGKVTTRTAEDGTVVRRFVAGGPRESSYNVFNALTDPKNAGYDMIRSERMAA